MLVNHIKSQFLALAILCTLSCRKNTVHIDCTSNLLPKDRYIYSVQPGSPEWNILNQDQRLSSSQIPETILRELSTESLIQSWLDFPLNYEIVLASDMQKGMEFFIQNFSGLAELTRRTDSGDKLLEKYRAMNPSCIVNAKTSKEKGAYAFSYTYIEMLLAQDAILKTLDDNRKKKLVSEALKKFNGKKASPSYGSFDIGNTLFVCVKAMRQAHYQPFLEELTKQHSFFLNTLLTTGTISTNDLNSIQISVIISHARKFIQ